jgi:exopolysaccharide production protein ExoZ
VSAAPIERPTLESIQALRGIAAMGVVLHHALDITFRNPIALGALGIDIFFVISGFVMYVSTRDHTRPGDFLLRRAGRIYPLYWFATAVTLAVGTVTAVPWPQTDLLVRSLLLVPPPSPHQFPVLFPAWTLVFEMFFYAWLAMGLLFARSRDGAALLAGGAVVLLGLCEYSAPSFPPLQYVLRTRLLEFALGLLVAFVWSRGHVPSRKASAVIVASAIVYLAFHPQDTIHGATPILVWGIPAAAIVFGLVSLEARGVPFASRMTRLFGDSSYAIYLFHIPTFAVAWWLLVPAGQTMQANPQRSLAMLAVLVAGAAAVGCATWYFVDRPVQTLLRRRRRSAPPVALATE